MTPQKNNKSKSFPNLKIKLIIFIKDPSLTFFKKIFITKRKFFILTSIVPKSKMNISKISIM